MKRWLLILAMFVLFASLVPTVFSAPHSSDLAASPNTGDIDLMIIIGVILICLFIVFIIIHKTSKDKTK